jgi:hypothetical protein
VPEPVENDLKLSGNLTLEIKLNQLVAAILTIKNHPEFSSV